MRERSSERLGATAGLFAAAAVAVPVVADFAMGDGDAIDGPAWLWWPAYGVFVAALAVDAVLAGGRPRRSTLVALLAVESVAGCTVYLADPGFQWVAVLLVVTAASGAYTLSPRLSSAQIVVQSLVIGIGQIADGGGPGDGLVSMAVYGSFQAFAVLVVHSEQRESAARAELASANVELRSTGALLARRTQAAERLRIARDLHDVIGHQLTALALELEVASHHVDGEGRIHVLRARATAKELLSSVRGAVDDLREPHPQLVEPLRELVDDLPGPAVSLEVVEEVEVGDEVAVAIIRCVQELVTNTVRHANAERLWVSVHTGPDGTILTARDDGGGAVDFRPGNGLTGMRERIESLGGRLVVDAGTGDGFRVMAQVPPR